MTTPDTNSSSEYLPLKEMSDLDLVFLRKEAIDTDDKRFKMAIDKELSERAKK